MMMKSADESLKKNLEIITRAVHDGSQTLRRILEFARRETTHDFARVDLAELVNSTIEIAKPKWESKSRVGKIRVQAEHQGPVFVRGDDSELREVVLNLLFNAVDALPEGGMIEVGTRAEIEAACFWVADTGCGMQP